MRRKGSSKATSQHSPQNTALCQTPPHTICKPTPLLCLHTPCSFPSSSALPILDCFPFLENRLHFTGKFLLNEGANNRWMKEILAGQRREGSLVCHLEGITEGGGEQGGGTLTFSVREGLRTAIVSVSRATKAPGRSTMVNAAT